ncbi:MAG TPA: hypothetical protein VLC09_06110 [Polyangiaceae bacterium]|nr:hypothetical protein [Polyangiaceae bacterium]
MSKTKWLGRSLVGLALVVGVLVVVIALRQDRKFSAPWPALQASQDPAVVERGRYLVRGLGHCVDCHADPGERERSGQDAPLSGGHSWTLPVGTFYSSNITPDDETGIGKRTDAEIARMLRHGVRPDGRALVPFMRFANLADDDLQAIVSYLRSMAPVHHQVKAHEPNALGRIVSAFVLEPVGPTGTPPATVKREVSAEYGRYLANGVGGCATCHTKISMKTGAFEAPVFSGGSEIPSETDASKIYVTPNLTPHPTEGWLEGWGEDAFVARLRGGRVHADSPMPWESYRGVSEDDARSIYRYLRSLPAAPGGPNTKTRAVLASAGH